MAPYIFTERETASTSSTCRRPSASWTRLTALSVDVAANGGEILFVGTKKQAADSIKEEADRCGMHYVNARWLGGMLTNFKTIQKRIERLAQLRKMEEGRHL